MDATSAARDVLLSLKTEIEAGKRIPILGPEIVLHLMGDPPPCPAGARPLSHELASKVAVPGRIRNNLWHTAQYIESRRHRVTLDRLMADLFKVPPEPTVLHRWLASIPDLPLIIDTWYDGTMARALEHRTDWAVVQGASKARRQPESPWCRAFALGSEERAADSVGGYGTVLYKPHGAAQPAGDVLASDADYVEVLTELDIDTPIPDVVKERRKDAAFLFLGCRFYDQILRSFARAFLKRSAGPHYAVVPAQELTRNEVRFLEREGIIPIPVPLPEAVSVLARPA